VFIRNLVRESSTIGRSLRCPRRAKQWGGDDTVSKFDGDVANWASAEAQQGDRGEDKSKRRGLLINWHRRSALGEKGDGRGESEGRQLG